MSRAQEIYSRLRELNLPSEAWALWSELRHLESVPDPDHLAAELRREKDRNRKREQKGFPGNSMETPIILEKEREGGVGGEETFPRKPLDALAPVLGAELGQAVVEHRQKLRAPLTLRAAQQLAKRLQTFPDPKAAAEKMLEKGWRSIELDWLNGKGSVVPFKASGPKKTWAEIKAEKEAKG